VTIITAMAPTSATTGGLRPARIAGTMNRTTISERQREPEQRAQPVPPADREHRRDEQPDQPAEAGRRWKSVMKYCSSEPSASSAGSRATRSPTVNVG
jgi:hypothetical protein